MNIEAFAGLSRFNARDYCERIVLKADRPDEAIFLAALYRAVISGGTATVTVGDKPEMKIRFFGAGSPS